QSCRLRLLDGGEANLVNDTHQLLGSNVRVSDLDLLYVRGEKRQCCEGCGTDCETLARGGCGVAKRVQCISPLTHFWRKAAHLCIAARVIGYRTVGVCG